jgi:hypothetical protein
LAGVGWLNGISTSRQNPTTPAGLPILLIPEFPERANYGNRVGPTGTFSLPAALGAVG